MLNILDVIVGLVSSLLLGQVAHQWGSRLGRRTAGERPPKLAVVDAAEAKRAQPAE